MLVGAANSSFPIDSIIQLTEIGQTRKKVLNIRWVKLDVLENAPNSNSGNSGRITGSSKLFLPRILFWEAFVRCDQSIDSIKSWQLDPRPLKHRNQTRDKLKGNTVLGDLNWLRWNVGSRTAARNPTMSRVRITTTMPEIASGNTGWRYKQWNSLRRVDLTTSRICLPDRNNKIWFFSSSTRTKSRWVRFIEWMMLSPWNQIQSQGGRDWRGYVYFSYFRVNC